MNFNKLLRFFLPLMPEALIAIKNESLDRLIDDFSSVQIMIDKYEKFSDDESPFEYSLKLLVIDENKLSQIIFGEALRFYLAALITKKRYKQAEIDNSAWMLIEQYYCSYFSIHFIIRILGFGINQLDQKTVKYIKLQDFNSEVEKINQGLHLLKFERNSNGQYYLNINKITSKKGGSHKDLWALWLKIISRIENLVKSDTDVNEYADLLLDISSYKKYLSEKSPPDIRGDINYQFSGGCWRFDTRHGDFRDKVKGVLLNEDILISNEETFKLKKFIEYNKFSFKLATEICKLICDKNQRSTLRKVSHKFGFDFNNV